MSEAQPPKESWYQRLPGVRLLRVKTKISERAIAVIGLIIGTILGVGGLIVPLRASKTIEENYTIVVFISLISGILFVLVIWYLLCQMFLIQRAFLAASTEKEALRIDFDKMTLDFQQLRAREALRRKSEAEETAPAFFNLSRLMRTFDFHASSYVGFVTANQLAGEGPSEEYHKNTEERWHLLQDAYNELLTGLCNTAVRVIPLRKEKPNLKHSANIKVVSDNVYRPLRRSSQSDAERYEDDKRISANRPLVSKNRIYHQISRRLNPDDRWLIVRDMKEFVAQTRALAAVETEYEEPTEAVLSFYQSSLVVAILAEHTASQRSPVVQRSDTETVIGFFCIDGMTIDGFDQEYDLQIMKQLANHASSAIRSFAALQTIRKAIQDKFSTGT